MCVCVKIGFHSPGATVHRQIDTNRVGNTTIIITDTTTVTAAAAAATTTTGKSIMLVSNHPLELAACSIELPIFSIHTTQNSACRYPSSRTRNHIKFTVVRIEDDVRERVAAEFASTFERKQVNSMTLFSFFGT